MCRDKTLGQMKKKERDYAHNLVVALWPLVVSEMNVSYRYDVTVLQKVFGDSLRVYKYAVPASPVDNACCIAIGLHYGMAATDER